MITIGNAWWVNNEISNLVDTWNDFKSYVNELGWFSYDKKLVIDLDIVWMGLS